MVTEVHIIPLHDSREHAVGEDCFCNPRVEYGEKHKYPVIIHNSEDMREAYEEACDGGIGGKPWGTFYVHVD